MYIDIEPVAKPRMTQSDKWKKRASVLKYWAFADELRYKFGETLPSSITLDFYIPMPKSWSKKKKEKMKGQWHKQKPDLSNLIKAVEDALCKEDSHIASIMAHKEWAEKGAIDISYFPD